MYTGGQTEEDETTSADVPEETAECEELEIDHASTLSRATTPSSMLVISYLVIVIVYHTLNSCIDLHVQRRLKSSTPTDDLEVEILKELRWSQSDAPDEDDLFGQSVAATLKKHNRRN